ncbi:MAG: NADH:ubiquinone oxidoreductase 27 kD subunit-like protein [Frankiales bacterium]|nr:NADH:ubiquinone oxidoreductase 27 kD subunit-like protein [Frankiales bacterium]
MTWFDRVQAARDEGFTFFDFLTAVDLEAEGFEVVLRLWDPLRHKEILLREQVPRDAPSLPTVTDLFKGAGWHERATAEMFGIAFVGHETQRLLLSEAFDGTPLRKDFVLAARVAKRWPGAKEPGESDADLQAPSRRRLQAPGTPKDWGPQ